MTGTEKQLVSEQDVADLWGQAPALLAWAEDNPTGHAPARSAAEGR